MDVMRAVRKAWVAYVGGAGFGFAYLVAFPPLDSPAVDSAVAIALVITGAALALLVESAASKRLSGLRALGDAESASREPVSVRS